MARRAYVVHVQKVAVDTGLWCDRCALPSVVVYVQAVLNQSRSRILGVVAFRWCIEHEDPT